MIKFIYTIVLFSLLYIFSCTKEPKEPVISISNYERDLNYLFENKVLSELYYLDYLFKGPKLLSINSSNDSISLSLLKKTHINPDSLWISKNKCIDSICVSIKEISIIDSVILFKLHVQNDSDLSIELLNFEIAAILGSEIARIYEFDAYGDKIILNKSGQISSDYYLPIYEDLFEGKYINEKYYNKEEVYKHIYNVVFRFSYRSLSG